MRGFWTSIVLLVLLTACSQDAVAPAPATPVPTPVPVEWPPTAVRSEPSPSPTAWQPPAVRSAPSPAAEPTPVPVPTATPVPAAAVLVGSPDDYGPEVVWVEMLIPPPENDPKLVHYLTKVLVGIDGGYSGPYYGQYSLEERILTSDVIVRVSLLSKRTSVGQRPPGGTWGALLEFRFDVHEYLKGSGPSEIGGLAYVEYPGRGGQANARVAVSQLADAHDSRWDDREAIVFLWLDDPDSGYLSFPRASDQYWLGTMVLSHWGEAYTVASRYRKAWLPEASQQQGQAQGQVRGQAGAGADKVFLLEAPVVSPAQGGAQGATTVTVPTISLSSLKTKITTLEAQANAGGTADYRSCVEFEYSRLRRMKSQVSQHGSPLTQKTVTLSSDDPAGQVLHTAYLPSTTTTFDVTPYWSFDGPDKDIVTSKILAFRPFRSSQREPGYDWILDVGHVTNRPLPADSYSFFHNRADPRCPLRLAEAYNHDRIDVAVTAPADTLHEAFFDPVAIGNAVGADGANGVLKPVAFTVGGASATVTSLKWEAGTVTMVLSPAAPLAGHAIHFIALNGVVTSALAVDDATRSGGTLTWSVATQPWNAGDLLMLRIRMP